MGPWVDQFREVVGARILHLGWILAQQFHWCSSNSPIAASGVLLLVRGMNEFVLTPGCIVCRPSPMLDMEQTS